MSGFDPRRPRRSWIVAVVATVVSVAVVLAAILVTQPRKPSAGFWPAGRVPLALGLAGGVPLSVRSLADTPLPPAVTAVPPPGSATVVTPATADAAFRALWDLREQALTGRDAHALGRVESGPVLTGDDIRVFCGCLVRTTPAPLQNYLTYVPRQTRYPAYFLATVSTGPLTSPDVEHLVVRRTSATEPWRVVLDSPFRSQGPDGDDWPARGASGFDATIPRSQLAEAARLPKRLAAYLQHAKQTGRLLPNSGFLAGPWTDQAARVSAETPNGHSDSSGLVPHTTYSARRSDPVFVATLSDGLLACGYVRWHAVVTSVSGVVQQDLQSQPFGATLPAGSYRSVVGDGTSQTCFYLSARKGSPVDVAGGSLDTESFYRGVH